MEFQSLNTAIGFAAEVSGIDLSQSMDDDIFLSIRDGLDRFGVLVFRGQALDEDSQIAFSRRFGPLETSIRRHRSRNVGRDELSDISNVAPDGGIYAMDSEHMSYNLGNQLWHADSSFKKIPALASLLYAMEVPPRGGETEFCDQRAAWDHLDEAMQTRLEGLTGQHSLAHSRAKTSYEADKSFREGELAEVPPVPQALVHRGHGPQGAVCRRPSGPRQPHGGGGQRCLAGGAAATGGGAAIATSAHLATGRLGDLGRPGHPAQGPALG